MIYRDKVTYLTCRTQVRVGTSVSLNWNSHRVSTYLNPYYGRGLLQVLFDHLVCSYGYTTKCCQYIDSMSGIVRLVS